MGAHWVSIMALVFVLVSVRFHYVTVQSQGYSKLESKKLKSRTVLFEWSTKGVGLWREVWDNCSSPCSLGNAMGLEGLWLPNLAGLGWGCVSGCLWGCKGQAMEVPPGPRELGDSGGLA